MRLGDIAKKSSLKLKMISEEELVDLHKVLLLMLDDLIEICKRNNLHFILIGGSAIGALRDKGFIPWDDDIDIAMPRRDFEKLYKIIKKQYSFKYSMLHPQDKENYGRILPKIRLKGTEYKTILEYDLNESGIFIDIYTIENIPDSIKVGCGVKSEGELVISGTEGYIYVPAPWWKTDYFEVRFENSSNNKRYFYQLDGEGIRYELADFVKTIEKGKSSLYISEKVSEEISNIMEAFQVGNNLICI